MLMQRELIRIATQFSSRPYGRYPEHGPDNGQRFREDFLLPALRAGHDVVVDLDGARGLGPSFLEEVFGGLVRAGFTRDEIARRVQLKSDNDPSYKDEVDGYLDEAAQRAVH